MTHGVDSALAAARELATEYGIVRELGRGSSAVVFLAEDRETERPVAIKLIHGALLADRETLSRFEQEARTAALLDHPNIVGLHAVKRLRSGALAMVMQYVGGGTLKQLIRDRGPLSCSRTERILHDIGNALGHAHRRGIVHRDVKPENIFLDQATGRALLSDFGIARSTEAPSDLTLHGLTVGTPAYMAPEQIDGRPVDGRTDIYSLAMVAWEMLSGRAPWEGASLYGIVHNQKHEALPDIRRERRDVAPGFAEALRTAMAKDPAERFPDVAALLAALERAPRRPFWIRWLEPHRRRRLRRAPAPPATPAPGGLSVRSTADGPPAALGRLPVEAAALPTVRFPRRPPRGASTAGRPAVPVPSGSTRARQGSTTPPSRGSTGHGDEPRPPPSRSAGRVAAVAVLASGTVVALAFATSLARAPESAPPNPAPTRPEPAGTGVPARAVLPPLLQGVGFSWTSNPPPAATLPFAPPELLSMAVGGAHTCVASAAGRTFCWGANDHGQLGHRVAERVVFPIPTLHGHAFHSLAAGHAHSCGITHTDRLLCWGSNRDGQLGTEAAGSHPVPIATGERLRFTQAGAGHAHTCALSRHGDIHCWGAAWPRGTAPGIGPGAPLRVGRSGFVTLAVGAHHTCATDAGGQAFCWGDNASGQLGTRAAGAGRRPLAVDTQQRFVRLAAGGAHTCGLTRQGAALCWGDNGSGQLGDGTTRSRSVPSAVAGGHTFVGLAAGGAHTCGLLGNGEVLCWGRNSAGQLGDGSYSNRALPTPVPSPVRFAELHASGAHSCAVSTAAHAYCWGANLDGQLGDGARRHRVRPARAGAPGA